MVCVGIISILGALIANTRMNEITFWHAATLITVAYGTVTWFIDIQADAAEAIQTCFLAEHYSSEGYAYMQRAHAVYLIELILVD